PTTILECPVGSTMLDEHKLPNPISRIELICVVWPWLTGVRVLSAVYILQEKSRQPMQNDSHRPDVAVFIDFENVYVSVRDKLDANPNFEMIMDRCEDLGRVGIAP